MSDERRRFMSNPNIAEAGRATRFAPGLKSTREASAKGNREKAARKTARELARLILSSPAPLEDDKAEEIAEALGIGAEQVTLQAAALFEIGKRAAGGDSKALDYLTEAAGDPKDDLWDFCT